MSVKFRNKFGPKSKIECGSIMLNSYVNLGFKTISACAGCRVAKTEENINMHLFNDMVISRITRR